MKIIALIFTFLLCVGILIIEWYYLHRDKRKERTKISFKEGLDLTELPIVTFYQGDKKLHFLLDTGSNISYINKEVLNEIKHINLNTYSNTFGAEGNGIETKHYKIEIEYKNQRFEDEFGAIDFTNAFKAIENQSGIKLHGILGNHFFEKYKYVLDFKELIAYR